MPVTAPTPAPRRRPAPLLVLVAVLAVLGLGGCQVKATVDTTMDSSGAGTVTVAVGLDDAAVKRVGDLRQEVKVDDLTQAGWTVTGPTKGDDGYTWFRASKPFRSVDELNKVLAEVAGPTGPLRDYRLETIDTEDATIYRVHGTVDLTKGLATFSDPELTAQLNGDPFGGQVQAIEAAEGRPVADMVSVEVTTRVGDGAAQVVRPTLKDARPVEVEASQSVAKPSAQPVLVYGTIGVVLVALVALMLVRVRRRFGATPR